MADKALPSPEVLRQLLSYDPETGVMTWRHRPIEFFPDVRAWKLWNTQNSNQVAFTADSHGYRAGAVLHRKMLAHRVCWAIHYGEWPSGCIDHQDGDRSNNSIINLRTVGRPENQRNQKKRANKTSGAMGVRKQSAKRWTARITVARQEIHLGSFTSFEDARDARVQAERKYGFHVNHGKAGRCAS